MNGTAEENRLKRELVGLFGHLNKLRRELASLHGGEEHNFVSMSETLDDIVKNTENASNTILESMESIDEEVGTLRASGDPAVVAAAGRINDRVNEVFEACSFQDLTGQQAGADRKDRGSAAFARSAERVQGDRPVGGRQAFQPG